MSHSPPKGHLIRIIGLREADQARRDGLTVVSTVSKSDLDWQRELSPFHLGPCPLPHGEVARCVENAWQFSKVYAAHADAQGNPTDAYWRWAREGWAKSAVRYPMGKGAKPLYLLWAGERLGYIEGRRAAYWTLYRDAVRKTEGFQRLQRLHEEGPVALFEFDGYDHDERGLSMGDVIRNTAKPMGHAFVLKSMLLWGAEVSAEDVETLSKNEKETDTVPVQASLFE